MKTYTGAAIVLMGVAIAFAMAALATFQWAGNAHQNLLNAEMIYDGAVKQREGAQNTAEKAQRDAVPVENFIKDWKDQFSAGDDLSQIFSHLDTLAVDNLLSSSDKSNNPSSAYLFKDAQRNVLAITIRVSGDYARIINWLGEVETTYPLARVEHVTFTVKNNTVSMYAAIVFPHFFEEGAKQ